MDLRGPTSKGGGGERRDRERGRGGRGKGRGEEKVRDPKGWLTPPCSKSWEIP